MTSDYTLAYGTHATPEDGRCAMEWVSHLAGEPHGDEPLCVSPVLRAMCIALNDGLDDVPRQRLRPFLARTIGTADDGLDAARAWMAMDWLIRTYTPVWLRAAGLQFAADDLSGRGEVVDQASLARALRALQSARVVARTARGEAFATARGGARASALAAGLAGREAAWTCAGAAAWAAARLGVGDIAGDRARAAARATAGDAAAIAARRARSAAGHAGARAAARAAIDPALEALTDSALALLDRMLPTELLELPELAQRAPALI
ncbi:MAG: hypothetical protein ABSH51_08130 [Solirubrobacteraceae bacterium]|jgi:hypothetical protein